jgi:hypothetical protein
MDRTDADGLDLEAEGSSSFLSWRQCLVISLSWHGVIILSLVESAPSPVVWMEERTPTASVETWCGFTRHYHWQVHPHRHRYHWCQGS